MNRRAIVLVLAVLAVACSGELVIENAERQLFGTTQRLVSNTQLTIKNRGSAAVDSIVICDLASLKEHAALYAVGLNTGKASKQLTGTPAGDVGAPEGVVCERYAHDVPAGSSVDVIHMAVYTHVLQPHPATVTQGDPQRVLLRAGLYIPSPYRATKEVTKASLGSGKVLAFTKPAGGGEASAKGGTITWGPFKDVQPFAQEELEVHYENTFAFAIATSLVREMEISHWGNVYFREEYNLVNAGAKLKGEWSRLDYMSRHDFQRNAVREVTAELPLGAHSLYYRDAIGNISTSAARFGPKGVTVALLPRYPLFGGWSTTFLFAWSMPLEGVVRKDPSTGAYTLATLFGPSVANLVVDELTVKVTLPEGATFLEYGCKLEDLEASFEKKYTYFDVTGRTVVVLHKRNVVPEMNVPFSVTYKYPFTAMLLKPLLLVTVFAIIFGLLMVYSHIDLSGNGESSSNGKLKAQ